MAGQDRARPGGGAHASGSRVRGHQLALADQHQHVLQQSADAMGVAWQSLQAVAHAWDSLTTGTSRPLSLIAAELDDLVLWIAREGNYSCPYTATASDIFEALVRLRRQLEPDGLMIAVQGARRDTYPSGMARDMGGGMVVYVMRPGRGARQKDLVQTLDDASPDLIATVDEQRAFARTWQGDKGSH